MTYDPRLGQSVHPAACQFNVVLLGDGPTALTAVRSLVASCRVAHILRTAPDPDLDPVHMFARAAGIAVSSLRGLDHLAEIISELRPAAVVISSFNRILPPSILGLSQFINVHY